MARDSASDNIDNRTVPIKAGIAVSATSPAIEVPESVVAAAEEDNPEDVYAAVAGWWDNLDVDERGEVLKLEEHDGRELIENLLFIDRLDTGNGGKVVLEY